MLLVYVLSLRRNGSPACGLGLPAEPCIVLRENTSTPLAMYLSSHRARQVRRVFAARLCISSLDLLTTPSSQLALVAEVLLEHGVLAPQPG